jgi:hypothetical protein
MRWEGTIALRYVNYLIGFASIGFGALMMFFSDRWEMEPMERVLYVAFFLSFGVAFILFGSAYKQDGRRFKRIQKRYFYIANGAAFLLLFFTFFSFQNELEKNQFWQNESAETLAKIYKIDPEGYRKQRMVYYTFEYKGEMYKGKKIDEEAQYRIGDTIPVLFSENSPEENKIKAQ